MFRGYKFKLYFISLYSLTICLKKHYHITDKSKIKKNYVERYNNIISHFIQKDY